MNRRTYFSSTAILALSAALLVGSPAHADGAVAACKPAFRPYGLIGEKWRASGPEDSIFRCPTSAEYGFKGNNARRQNFANGQIGWSPAQGPKMMISTYQSDGKAVFQWGPTGRDWDYFEVRYSYENDEVTTYKVKRRDPWNGGFSRPAGGPGGPGPEDNVGNTDPDTDHYFSVRGCDNTGPFQLGSECGGWSLPGRL
jgi:hypothetical protein